MKKVLLAVFILAGSLAFQQKASAQVGLSINIGTQPAWGPTGYNYVQYYYLPDINCYFDVSRGLYYYLSARGNRWISAKTLPHSRYGRYNLYNMYKVVLPNRTGLPYMNNAQDLRQYGQYKGQRSQPVIRDSKDSRYFQNPGNTNYRKPQQNTGRGGR